MATDDPIHDGDVVMRVETDDSTDHRRDQDAPLHEGEGHHDQRTMESVEQAEAAGGEGRRKSNIESILNTQSSISSPPSVHPTHPANFTVSAPSTETSSTFATSSPKPGSPSLGGSADREATLQYNRTLAQSLPVRSYLDETVVPVLLEGMKVLVKERPENPLEYLGQYLINRAKENAATSGNGTSREGDNTGKG
ncbi:Dpy-30 motif-domain-containing protein [Endogone sp. FLAS-F59071]|nr:Dpy-30 motif-domain-containing protein [Endogone sp. FLAS-F59071]|eukprot:RUS14767.1 Dpy-30 motif-domain-containing protein [Endogone sp. FLAS-F59071]